MVFSSYYLRVQSCEQADSALGHVLSKECFTARSLIRSSAESSTFVGLGGCSPAKDSTFWIRHRTEVMNFFIFS